MNNLIPKNKFIIIATTVALLSIILYCAGLFVVLREKRGIEELYLNTESESAKEEKIRVIKNVVEINKDLIQTLQNYFIQKDDEIKFIEQIEKTAQSSGIKFEIASIDVGGNQTDSFKEDINVKIKIEGSWHNIMYFINKLEKIPFGILIKDLNLDSNVSGSWSGAVEFIIFREK